MRVDRLFVTSAIVSILWATGASGCAKKKPAAMPTPPPAAPATPPTRPPTPPPPPPPPAPAPTPSAPLTEEEIFSRKTLDELNAEKLLDDVFFDYDSDALTEPARAKLQKDADWLKRYPTTKVTIEGHCDSRGSSEYNLGLGERRASAARNYVVSLGVATDRVTSISKGKESPFCTEENETCWTQNRRGHFIITAK